MSEEVTYQGVIPPNRFDKAALKLEIQGEQQESTIFFGENTYSWFSVERKEMSPDSPPNSTCGPKWGVPRGQVQWAPSFGPRWPSGVPLLAVSSRVKITYL